MNAVLSNNSTVKIRNLLYKYRDKLTVFGKITDFQLVGPMVRELLRKVEFNQHQTNISDAIIDSILVPTIEIVIRPQDSLLLFEMLQEFPLLMAKVALGIVKNQMLAVDLRFIPMFVEFIKVGLFFLKLKYTNEHEEWNKLLKKVYEAWLLRNGFMKTIECILKFGLDWNEFEAMFKAPSVFLLKESVPSSFSQRLTIITTDQIPLSSFDSSTFQTKDLVVVFIYLLLHVFCACAHTFIV
ncbi:hypothetical protein RFI_14860 [Reticulomyxa filosa]|uniref:Symplekin C-terminal domain-containing protein n=1 Tax=Reticulomyxa filosa TaxID=46433 RepID=X6N9A2_RETFI|nr:hypothetical protein RFI_14860 [Reticulomyxa filosa]|eukprot:ETO22334.1 hypothetical protein RFI_14860 [Reticulomyxa filosa]